jgi:nitrogen fixation NifU-like protein
MDHFTNPRNTGEIENASGIGTVGNAKCGDIMRVFLKIEDGIIADVKFKTFGCAAAIATSSIATELIKGKTLTEALALTNQAVAEALGGLPPVKMHCSLLAEQAVKAAIEDYLKKCPPAEENAAMLEACKFEEDEEAELACYVNP